MPRLQIHSLTVLALICITAGAAFAKDPCVFASPSIVHAAPVSFGSLTPPPKEWAMFPQDEPPATTPQNGQTPAQSNTAAATGNSVNGGSTSGGIVSAANTHSAPRRELPLFWLVVTGALSFGAITACGSLILRKDATPETDLPVVSDLQEITA